MAPKSLLLAALLLVGLVPLGAQAATASVRITGVVPCSAGSSIDVTKVSVFPNAGLQLVCSDKVVASTTADGTGSFLISISGVGTELLAVLLGNHCKVVVITPLAACDASLAGVTGTLTAPLKLLGAAATGTTGNGGILDLGGILGPLVQIIGSIIGGILDLGTQAFTLV
ncbi:hypothetical protein PR202_ga25795 [Eleusine coracana subsp. coracana]|uniref:Uncharacterized protein n=1 Tax=Eleusine coracana subsp. coracana TaxID=191504 RepID=A0AAV5DBM9_ELECO|nr:hypothetical protein QOZ80_3AG0247710 [Eleusine coracana subsp. coracana]GJN07922.1 hypothetical protein PR202_ga25795 [Eleusine coracana subsp. coracana]